MENNNHRYQHLIRQDCPLPPGTHVALYTRDSGGDEQDRSVNQQDEVGREYCAMHGLVIEHVYKDEARLSSNTDRREALQEMLSDLRHRFKQINDRYKRERAMKEHPFGVIFWKSNRLGRDRTEASYIKADLALRGITVIDLVTSANTGNAGIDALIEAYQQWRDEQALNDISLDAKRGLAKLVTTRDNDPDFLQFNPNWKVTGNYLGIMPGSVPVGFKAERITIGTYKRKGGKRSGELRVVQRIVPDPKTWDRARLAWEMRREGSTLQEIIEATRLYKSVEGYVSFFSNIIYTGVLEYGGSLIENFVPALIPMEWYHDEQARRLERGKKRRGKPMDDPTLDPRRMGAKHLLSGILYCGEIDGEHHPMLADYIPAKGGVRGHWDFYICSRKKNSRGLECTSRRIGARNLEKQVINSLMTELLTFDILRPLVDQISQDLGSTLIDADLRLKSVQEKIGVVERQLANLIKAIEDVGLSASLKVSLNKREAELEVLRIEAQQLEGQLADYEETPQIDDETLRAWIEYMRSALESTDTDLARRAVRQFVDRIVIRNGEGEIHYRLGLPQPEVERIHLGRGSVDLRGYLSYPSQNIIFKLRRSKHQKARERHPDKQLLHALVIQLREAGYSYRQIGVELGIHWTRVEQILNT